jgi:hypothetical protein
MLPRWMSSPKLALHLRCDEQDPLLACSAWCLVPACPFQERRIWTTLPSSLATPSWSSLVLLVWAKDLWTLEFGGFNP